MGVKRRKIDTSLERQILTGMIVSDRFLREIIPIFHPDLLEIQYGPIIAKWCTRHFSRYEKAPGINIQDIYAAWKRSDPDPEQVTYIEEFLATLSDEFERGDKFNTDYIIDKTIEYFETRSLRLLSEDIKFNLDNNNLVEARKCMAEYRKVEKIVSPGIDVFEDEEAWQQAFESSGEQLFNVPGKLGEMLNPQFTRDSFIALMGIAKIGKTWNMTFLTHCAVRARCNVAMFQCGDLSQGQMMVRNGIFFTQRSNKPKYCKEILIPTLDCEHNQKDTCDLRKRTCKFGVYDSDGVMMDYDECSGYEPCTECQGEYKSDFKGALWYTRRPAVKPLTWQEAYQEAQKYKKRYNAKRFKLSTHSSKTLSVTGIKAQLDYWEAHEGFIPDVIIIDYADILAPEPHAKGLEFRHSSNETWMALRGLSQERHCCVITATQANGSAIKEKSVGREHYSEDRRKYDHVTAMFALSQTNEEKRRGVTRWGAIVLREDDWDETYHVNVGGCLQIGRPYLFSW